MPSTLSPSDFLDRFGLTQFRSGQEAVIQQVLDGKDVLCVMPTGGGKSLCYQLPSVMLDGLTIVVSPLIALMQDQVDVLQKKGFRATLINSSLKPAEQFDRMQAMAEGKYDLIYIAPERLRNSRFLESVRKTKVSLLAVDEAHCISEWGHDFRPDYARLGQFRIRNLGGVQTIALTATATPTVRDDIVKLLSLHEPKPFITGFARENLRFAVSPCGSDREKDQRLAEFLRGQKGIGIIYAATRKRCEEIALWLPGKLGKPVGIYHGGLDPQQRRSVQEDFMAGKLAAIVATNAFGMGIDKSDIRYVVHYNMPGSLEAYYQEAGRAGRDGLPSECLLLFSYSDRYIQEFFIENNYPTRDVVAAVYKFLHSRTDDPIEMTLDQIREKIGLQVGGEAIGTAERLLAKTGVLERLDSSANQAIIRIDSTLPTLVDMLPREAKVRRRVLQAAEKIIGDRREEDVYFSLDRIVKSTDQSRESVTRTLRELSRLRDFDYVPPFRGRAIHFRKRDVPFNDLKIDFVELERRKRAEYEKLDHVIRFAQTPNCRQLAVLNYFGDPAADVCGNCDRCDLTQPRKNAAVTTAAAVPLTAEETEEQQLITQLVRIVLSALARTHGRFGKGLVAQMLAGSQNKKLQQLKLDRLSTFGLLKGLKQAQVTDLLDAVCSVGMAQQIEVTQRRPTVKLTDFGQEVMKGNQPVPVAFTIARPLKIKAMALVRKMAAAEDVTETPMEKPKSTANPDLLKTLRKWRLEAANELGVPAYRIVSNATLEAIAAKQPQSVSELESIRGIVPETVEQYGYALVQLIESQIADDSDEPLEDDDDEIEPQPPSVRELPKPSEEPRSSGNGKPVAADPIASPQPPATDTPATASPNTTAPQPATDNASGDPTSVGDTFWTWKLLRDGYTAEQCCAIRQIDRETLLSHLIDAVRDQRPVQLDWVAGEDSKLLATIAAATDSAATLDGLIPSHWDPKLLQLAREAHRSQG
ncbi:RecQ family ATP-dependent DNA helicase [Rosistilla oblonga]|uniref:RecQ family ATP-dependent DNA helicase n=1 Tax=Rosistilla oblonga TaxID=2527990 RepID=UPI003A985C60